MIIYNKLIRDRISEIIEVSGKKCEVRRLNDDEYLEKLNEKLMEELKEYYESGSIEELADLVEVVHAIVKAKGSSVEKLRGLGWRRERNEVSLKKGCFWRA
ncbi:nucleoside triphosphate pyrophosphohydrolase [Fonticella tunisiensis]|uniref:Putative house-cleaning noncanonical NTP pyrophosphatase (MazG superfamily) n=1 Tax=Fonticella tunisiensis TaxID=1096341 RepID=A0A4R7K4Z1_9CLOT|nr:nucleoside triphosphate pyrophosphohydrolase [Fonticella tunisiensis]TDT46070.1 putative house-cleaning noncanonical NTP pyrophosphatase (MazG superfamily) [Fonticella tunisiensis]